MARNGHGNRGDDEDGARLAWMSRGGNSRREASAASTGVLWTAPRSESLRAGPARCYSWPAVRTPPVGAQASASHSPAPHLPRHQTCSPPPSAPSPPPCNITAPASDGYNDAGAPDWVENGATGDRARSRRAGASADDAGGSTMCSSISARHHHPLCPHHHSLYPRRPSFPNARAPSAPSLLTASPFFAPSLAPSLLVHTQPAFTHAHANLVRAHAGPVRARQLTPYVGMPTPLARASPVRAYAKPVRGPRLRAPALYARASPVRVYAHTVRAHAHTSKSTLRRSARRKPAEFEIETNASSLLVSGLLVVVLFPQLLDPRNGADPPLQTREGVPFVLFFNSPN
ncbi:hypothetical protein PLICRDRAFT_180907 [Plicaturopsis crispa FD-325 SS-3]|uniref:Uncharacterized protein n=1 Tax=Plicaturopsis crispa FD-325 SS-3 TaxID=944288 RepID=A0A0C9SPR6_PLICR|nr:hypothetical protein PLICRDRAFT_180907 [Plicaturopsis crispa FD-325 SS-3]